MQVTPKSGLTPVGVVGAGAWGTMLAQLLAHNEALHVTLWARRATLATELTDTRLSPYVPGLELSKRLTFAAHTDALTNSAAVFIAVPSRALREVLGILPHVRALVSATKGLEQNTLKRPTEVVQEFQPHARIAALSGPNLVGELALGLPSSATVASSDPALARLVQGWLNQNAFRVYTGGDLSGLELGGALKNVIALAAGLCDGLGLGDNAKAAIVTRGLAEIVRLGTRLGGQTATFYGLSGLGDLFATCSSPGSRNHRAGVALAQGGTLADLETMNLTAEGVPTVRAVVTYARAHGLELPISEAVYGVIYEAKTAAHAVQELMARDPGAET